jgi:c(7)-type cytochrome triheme protein
MINRQDFSIFGIWIRYCVAGALLIASFCGVNPLVLAQGNDGQSPVKETRQVPGSDQRTEPAFAVANTAADDVTAPEEASDYVGEIYQIGLGWHPAALDGLPKDKFGLVDWVAALEQGLIQPRANISVNVPEVPPFDMNIVMPSKTGMIAGAYFPHKTHTTWLACESCHIKIFMPLAGSNDLTMSTIVEGNACGVCHGKVAFPLNDCARCHIPQSDGIVSSTAE